MTEPDHCNRSKATSCTPALRWLRFENRLVLYVLVILLVVPIGLAAWASVLRAVAFVLGWYGAVRLLARVVGPYVSLNGSWFGFESSLMSYVLDKGRLTREISVRVGLGFVAWAVLPWAIAVPLLTVQHWLVPVLVLALYVVWGFLPPQRES